MAKDESSRTIQIPGVGGVLLKLLDKHGFPTVLAIVLLVVMYLTLIVPAAAERETQAEERAKLLNVVTNTMERNSDAMEKMAGATSSIERTLRNLEEMEKETQAHLKGFTDGVDEQHKEHDDKLDTIIDQTKDP